MKRRLRCFLAFSLAATSPLTSSYIHSVPDSEVKWPAPKTVRQINDIFKEEMLTNIRETYKTASQFTCLELMPYDRELDPKCKHPGHFVGWVENGQNQYRINAKLRNIQFYNDLKPEMRDMFQFFVAAHEFKHYLNYQRKRFDWRSETDEEAILETKRRQEVDADMFALTAVSIYHLDRFGAFMKSYKDFRVLTASENYTYYKDLLETGVPIPTSPFVSGRLQDIEAKSNRATDIMLTKKRFTVINSTDLTP